MVSFAGFTDCSLEIFIATNANKFVKKSDCSIVATNYSSKTIVQINEIRMKKEKRK